jgi:5'-nucleotidase
MAYDIANKLVIAVASSALFQLDEADAIFREHGEDEYRSHQRQHESVHLEPGVAFSFVKRLLSFNAAGSEPLVEVVLLSRNDPDTGLRVMNSIETHALHITRAAFVKGREPYRYIRAFNASLFLSANEQDVRNALELGSPAGLVMESAANDRSDDLELRIAFDFDGVLADDASEAVFNDLGLPGFEQSERDQAQTAHAPGPLHGLLIKLATLQQLEKKRARELPGHKPRLRLALVTARGAPAHKRVVTTLRSWGIDIDETFFLDGMQKTAVLSEFRPHLFFDDQVAHLRTAAAVAPCVHVPFGVRNRVA